MDPRPTTPLPCKLAIARTFLSWWIGLEPHVHARRQSLNPWRARPCTCNGVKGAQPPLQTLRCNPLHETRAGGDA
eukprot:10061037-Lingulodinium_polyedra.AAC.1